MSNASGTSSNTHVRKYPIYVQTAIRNYCSLGPRIRTYKIVRNARLTLLASLRNFNDEQKNVFDGECSTKAFMKAYGQSWARVLSQQGFKDAQNCRLGWRAHHDGLMHVHLHVNHHFYLPAQLVGGFALSDLLEKPWSQVSSLLPPGRAFIRVYRA